MPLPATCALAGGPVDSCVRQTLVSVRQKTDAIAGSASVSLLPVGARRVSSVAVRLVAVLASGPSSLRWGTVRSQMPLGWTPARVNPGIQWKATTRVARRDPASGTRSAGEPQTRAFHPNSSRPGAQNGHGPGDREDADAPHPSAVAARPLASGANVRPTASTTASPIRRMGTSADAGGSLAEGASARDCCIPQRDGWRECSRPELWAVR